MYVNIDDLEEESFRTLVNFSEANKIASSQLISTNLKWT